MLIPKGRSIATGAIACQKAIDQDDSHKRQKEPNGAYPEHDSLKDADKTIGMIERSLVLTFVLMQQYQAIGTNAETARQQLIDHGWVITGDSPSGVDCSVNATARIANTSVENLPKELITFYPNPAQHQLNIQLAATTVEKIDELVIRSVSGKVLKKKTLFPEDFNRSPTKLTIDVSTLSKEVYILEITGRGTSSFSKFIKK